MRQAIEGIVGIVIARFHALVAEENGLLRGVANGGDVAHRIVGVEEVLDLASGPVRVLWRRTIVGKAGRVASGEHPRQTGGVGVVVVPSPGAVAIVDQRATALGVVIDVGDKGRLRRRARQIDADGLQHIGSVVGGTRGASIGRGGRGRTVERIVLSSADEGAAKHWRCRPVR